MTVSFPVSSTFSPNASRAISRPGRSHGLKPARSGSAPAAAPAALAALLMLVAVLVAPERPQVQEAICQRHNGVVACRVW